MSQYVLSDNLNRTFGRPRRRGKENIKVYIKERVNMVHPALDRDQWRIQVDTVVKLRVLKERELLD
jgi:hypothetical protein